MRSRAGSWSLAFVLVLSVLVIAGSNGPGFLALAQTDGTPAVEEAVPEEQAPVEVATETFAPEVPTEIPVFPTEILNQPTEPALLSTETLVLDEEVAHDAIVEAASESGNLLNISECTVSPAYWLVHLSLDQQEFPTSLTFSFASGAQVAVSFSGISWVEGSGYRGTYVTTENLGTGDQLITVTGDVHGSLNPVAYLKFASNCTPAGPTATSIPTVTPTPTWSGTTTTISSTFVDCEFNASLWQFRLTTQGAVPGGAGWPAAVELTFASGATGIATKVTETIGESAAQLEFRSTDNLSDGLVSGTVALPTGVTGTLQLMYAPNCVPGSPVTATNIPSETATNLPTETTTATRTATDMPNQTPTETVTITPPPTETPTEITTPAGSSPTATSAPLVSLPLSFANCQASSSWRVYLNLPVHAFPDALIFTFASGATASAPYGGYAWGSAGDFHADYETEDYPDDALIFVAGVLSAGVTGSIDVVGSPNCPEADTPTASAVTTTSSSTPTETQTETAIATETATPSATAIASLTNTPTSSSTATATVTQTDTATATLTPSDTPTETATATSTATATASPTVTETATKTPSSTATATVTESSTPTDVPTETATAMSTPTETVTPSSTATESPSITATATATDTPTITSTPTEEPTLTSTSTSTATASATLTVTATPTWSGDTTTHWATFDECNPNPEIWYFRLTVQGTLPGGAGWPASVALSFASGATGAASGFDQVIGENAAQLWFSSNGNLGDALVSATVELPSELTGLLELLYAPNCIQGVLVTATSFPTETMTASATATDTPTETASSTSTATLTPTATATATASSTATDVLMGTASATVTATTTPTATSSATATSTPSEAPSETPSATATPTATATATATPSSTAAASSTSTSTTTATATSTPTETATVTSSSTLTNTATVTESASTSSSTPTASNTASATATNTAVPMVRTTVNVNCRTGAATSTTSLGVVARGTLLPVRGAVPGGWTPVVCFGQNGWISSSYLGAVQVATATVPASATMTTTARVNCRTGGSTGSSIIGVVLSRTGLTLRGAVQGGWYPVVCFGQNGWISASYLAPGPAATATLPSGPTAVTTTRVNCRTAPTTSQANVITVLNSGVAVPIRGASQSGWTPVVCGGQNGWISSRYLRSI